jgi:hypothetical protein
MFIISVSNRFSVSEAIENTSARRRKHHSLSKQTIPTGPLASGRAYFSVWELGTTTF